MLRLTEEQAARAERLHEQAIVIAAHTDLCPDLGRRQRGGEVGVLASRHLPGLRKGGITAVCDHVAGDTPWYIDLPFRNTMAANRLKFAVQGIEAIYHEAEATPESVLVATTAEDIRRAKREGKLAVVLCFEGAGPIEDDLSLLDIYHRLGVRCIGVTHNARNLLADGVTVGGNYGLTALGREAVAEMNRLGIVVDVSHISFRGFWDIVETSTGPVHSSHSSCFDLCDHPRNLTDEMLRAVAQSGGVVGVHAMSDLLARGRRATLEDLLNHLERMIQVMGEDHVAIGPDLMEESNYCEQVYAPLWTDPRLPPYNFVYPEEFDSLAKFPNITAGLVVRGFSDETILKVMGGNMLRLFEQVWRQPGETPPRRAEQPKSPWEQAVSKRG